MKILAAAAFRYDHHRAESLRLLGHICQRMRKLAELPLLLRTLPTQTRFLYWTLAAETLLGGSLLRLQTTLNDSSRSPNFFRLRGASNGSMRRDKQRPCQNQFAGRPENLLHCLVKQTNPKEPCDRPKSPSRSFL
ncbi:MAG: hypothetical protein R3C53_16345 [Pirellulaceae bacterium]